MSELSNTFGIDSFYQNAVGRGFARDFQFRVLRLGNWISDPGDLLYITTATMPGRLVNAVAVPYMGLNFQVPGTANYGQNAAWPVTFRCDESLNIRNILENWSYGVFDDRTSQGSNIPSNDANHIVELVAIDNAGNPRKTISLIGAWCTTVGDVSYNLTGNGQVVTVQATLAYQYWRSSDTTEPQRPAQPGELSAGV